MPKKFPNKNYKDVIEYYNDYSKSLNETLDLLKSYQIKNVLSLLNKSIQNGKNIFILVMVVHHLFLIIFSVISKKDYCSIKN